MAWDNRSGRLRLKRTVRRSGGYRCRYLGIGLAALAAAARWHDERQTAAARRAAVHRLVALTVEALTAARQVRDRAFVAAGWRQHRRGFRAVATASPRPVRPTAVARVEALAAVVAQAADAIRSLGAGPRVVARADARRARVEQIARRLADLTAPAGGTP